MAVYYSLLNGKLYALYFSPIIIRQIKSRRMRWAGLVTRTGDERCIQGLVVKVEGRRRLRRPRLRWEDNIKIDLQELGWWSYGLARSGSG
jgi:hypothetical protein